ncbi:TPA: hypothetical protein ACH3X1_007959 [Trebouxia sp. C0004]
MPDEVGNTLDTLGSLQSASSQTIGGGSAHDTGVFRQPPSQYTVTEAVDYIGFGRFQWLMLLYTGLAWCADAMEMMLLSFLGPAAKCEWALTPSQESLITSVVFVGTMSGAYAWGSLGDAKGRKLGFFATALFTFTFGILSAVAPSYGWLIFFRFWVGLGLGGVPVSFTLYMEFMPTRGRGVWLIWLEAFWTLGSCIEAGLAWLVLDSLGWRWLLGLSAIPLGLLMVLYPLLPETPYWLVLNGDPVGADAVLQKMAKVNGVHLPQGGLMMPSQKQFQPDPASPAVSWQQRVMQPYNAIAGQLKEIFSGGLLTTTLLLQFIWFTNALAYYGLVLLTTSLHTSESSEAGCDAEGKLHIGQQDLLSIFVTSTAEMPGMVFSSLLVDYLGRKRTLMASLALCGAATVTLMWVAGNNTAWLFLGRAAVMASYTTLYVYTPEVYPTQVRSFGLGVCNACSRFGALLSPFLTVDLVEHGHPQLAEGTLAVCCAIAAVLTWLLPIETKARSLLANVKDKAAETQGPEDVVVHDSLARPASPQHRWRHQRYRPLHGDGADSPFNADSSDGSL